MKISVITPSRLAVNPNSPDRNLWLDLSLSSVKWQTVFGQHEIEILVGTDDSAIALLPERFQGGVRHISAGTWHRGQAGAVNGCVKMATGDVLAFLEDDDTWEPGKLAYQLPLLERFDFVSCNQREVAEDRMTWLRVNDFATPSGWVMKRALWDELGGMDETFKFHVDTQFLGKLNAAGKKRIHLVEEQPDWQKRPWLGYISKHSIVATTQEREQLVQRTVNSKGGMARIQSDPAARAISEEEHRRMIEMFGAVPW